MGDRFRGDVVLVTGAAGQIGSGCVDAFAAEGARVVGVDLVDFGPENRSVVSLASDLKHEAEIQRVFDVAESGSGPVSILVQCAAVYGRIPYLDITAENIDHILGINVRTVMLAGRIAARSMIANDIRGSIINFTSTSGVVADAESVGYEASKGAVTMATKGMAVALAPYGIRVNAVGPGSMAKFQEIEPPRDPYDLDAYERQRIPLGRLGLASDIAEAVMYLASPAAAYVTGTVLYVDGGALATWVVAQPEAMETDRTGGGASREAAEG